MSGTRKRVIDQAPAYTLTKDDWRALYALLFGLAPAICTRGVHSLPDELAGFLLALADVAEAPDAK